MSKQLKSHLQWRRVLKAQSTWRINLESGRAVSRAVAKLPVAAWLVPGLWNDGGPWRPSLRLPVRTFCLWIPLGAILGAKQIVNTLDDVMPFSWLFHFLAQLEYVTQAFYPQVTCASWRARYNGWFEFLVISWTFALKGMFFLCHVLDQNVP